MTYQSDPTRWTESPGEAPELLRGAFKACIDERPSDFQMRSLALKLAVVGSGAAVMAGTSAAAASAAGTLTGTTAVTASSGGALSLAKAAVASVALLGAAATGAVLVRRDAAPVEPARMRAPVVQTAHEHEPSTPERLVPAPATPKVEVEAEPAPALATPEQARTSVSSRPRPIIITTAERSSERAASHAERSERRHARRQARIAATIETAPVVTATPASAEANALAAETTETTEVGTREHVRSRGARAARLGELDLLHGARAALSMRPLAAYALTEQHRSTYPDGVFAQERDALAVEALLRAGDLDRARTRAEKFIERYPSSPHAHRFRETMNLQ